MDVIYKLKIDCGLRKKNYKIKMSSTTGNKIMLKKLKEMNTIWHPESTLVFKSKEEQLVIGRWVDTAFVELDEVCLELSDTWKFKIDDSLIEQEDEKEQNDDNSMQMDSEVENITIGIVPSEVLKKDDMNFADMSDAVNDSINSVFAKLNQLSNELRETKDKLKSRDTDYETLKIEFDSIQSKFAKLKSLLG